MNRNINETYQNLMKKLEKHKKEDCVKNAKEFEEDITKNIRVGKKTKNKTPTPYPTQYVDSNDNIATVEAEGIRSLSVQNKRTFTTFEKVMIFISNFLSKFF